MLIKAISYNRATALTDVNENKMALNLNIPAIQENPLFLAETRPLRIKQSLSELDSINPIDVALHLRNELEILNRQRVSISNRLQALECYRPLVSSTAQALAEDYCNATLPLHDKAKSSAAAAESLWLELGYGYKLALIDLQNQLIKLGTDKTSAEAIQFAIYAIAEQAMVHYQTYFIPPEHIWSDLHQLYFCAVQLGIQNISIQTTAPITKNNNELATPQPIASIESAYKHAMLMSLAEPQHLPQNDLRLVANYLTHHVNHAQITAVTPLENESAAFIIGLNSNSPPVPYSKKSNAPNPANDILLQTINLVRAVHQDLSQLQSHQLPKNGSIPAHANRDDYIELLTYLIKNWGITPKRIYNRSLKNGEIDLVAGIVAIQRASDENLTSAASKNTPAIAKLQTTSTTPSRWKTLNISATGISLRRHHTAEKNIRVGSLIGIKAKGESNWSIGIVRWANCGTRDRLDIGIQLIAPQAQGAIANINDCNKDELVLLVSEITAARQPANIIAPKGTYGPARQLTLTYKNKTQQIMLTKLIERSHYVERMQFSIVG